MTATFYETEARQLADDEHRSHTLRIETMRMDCEYSERNVFWYERDYGYHDDPAAFFEAHRASFLEEARELYADLQEVGA